MPGEFELTHESDGFLEPAEIFNQACKELAGRFNIFKRYRSQWSENRNRLQLWNGFDVMPEARVGIWGYLTLLFHWEINHCRRQGQYEQDMPEQGVKVTV